MLRTFQMPLVYRTLLQTLDGVLLFRVHYYCIDTVKVCPMELEVAVFVTNSYMCVSKLKSNKIS